MDQKTIYWKSKNTKSYKEQHLRIERGEIKLKDEKTKYMRTAEKIIKCSGMDQKNALERKNTTAPKKENLRIESSEIKLKGG